MLAELLHDLRFVARAMGRNVGFSVAVAVTLALGIGALSAVFSAVYGVLLRPLPYRDGGRLVTLWVDLRANGRAQPEWLSFPDVADWREQSRSLDGVAAWTGWAATLGTGGEPERVPGASVSWNYFPLLGANALVGRTFRAEEDAPSGERVVVLTEGLWRRRFGADPTIVGRAITLNDEPWTVVGVLPALFRPPTPGAQLWRPLRLTRASSPCGRGCVFLQAIGRVRPGIAVADAQHELTSILQRVAKDDPDAAPNAGAWLIPLHEQIVGDVRLPLLMLTGTVVLVLLLTCANLANLLLVRGLRRSGELAVRLALGADRGRIRRQLLTESIALAVLGGTAGLVVASAGAGVLRAIMPPRIAAIAAIHLDWRVVAFTAAASVITGLLFGAAPAFRLSDLDVAQVLREDARGAGGRRDGRIRDGLVIAQFALALVLLSGAALLTRSFLNLTGTDLGFRPHGLLAVELQLPRGRYPTSAEAGRFYEMAVERLRSIPGATGAGATSIAPLSGGDMNLNFRREGQAPMRGQAPSVWYRQIVPGYLETMGVPLRSGRLLTPNDRTGAPLVAVINEAAARTYWAGASPLGAQIFFDGPGGGEPTTIVGVVGDVRHDGQRQPLKPEIYVSAIQQPARGMTLVVRGRGDATALVSSVRRMLRQLEPSLPIGVIAPLETRYAEDVALPRLFMVMLSAFGVAALLLASVGIYGLVSYGVEVRAREFGIRMAIGARPSRLVSLVVRKGFALAAAGVALGALGAIAAGRLIDALLVGVSSTDPVLLIATSIVLLSVGTLATLIPARRAMKTDPVVALRSS